jgi:hypothetical protein
MRPPWTIEDGVRLRIADCVYVSFERTRRQDANPTRSYGAAPIATDGQEPHSSLLVPSRDDEGFWLGLTAVDDDRPCAVRVIVREPAEVDAMTGAAPLGGLSSAPQNFAVVPPQYAVMGVTTGHGVARPFVRVPGAASEAACQRVQFLVYASVQAIPRSTPAPSLLQQSTESDRTRPGNVGGLVTQHVAPDPYGLEMWHPAPAADLRVEIVAPETYAGRTAQPAPGPLSDDTRYGGWRLP